VCQVVKPRISKRLIASLLLVIVTGFASAQTQKFVLVLHGGWPKLADNEIADQQIENAFGSDRDLHIQIFNEYRDEKRLGAADHQFMQYLGQKYSGQRIDLIVTVSPIALWLLLHEGQSLWPNVPVVFCTIDRRMLPEHLPGNVFGVANFVDAAGTVDLALRLQPGLNRIYYVVGTSEWEQFLRRAAEKDFQYFAGRITIEYLDHFSLAELLTSVSQLPSHSAIFYQEFNKDVDGRTYFPLKVCTEVSVSSNVPTYAPFPSSMGYGVVGGNMTDIEGGNEKAARMALRILRGERLTTQVEDAPPSRPIVDWRQLRRWQFQESSLPAGTIVEFREPTLWQRYKWYISIALALLAIQFLQIIKLRMEAKRRKRSESELAERLQFETLLARIASSFSIAKTGDLNDPILAGLRGIHDFFDVTLASIWQGQLQSNTMVRTHVWPQDAALRISVTPEQLPDTVARVTRGETVQFANEAEMASLKDREAFRDAGIKSFLAISLRCDENTIRVLSLINTSKATVWRPDIVSRLHMIADILGHVLVRQSVTEALQESEVVKGSILESLQNNVCVIDSEGVIIEVNRGWEDFAAANSKLGRFALGLGANYLEICRKSHDTKEAMEALTGILSVLDGSRHFFEMEYACHSPTQQRWFRMTVIELPLPKGGAVISHFDITQQRITQIDRDRIQEEMVQLHRATEMGQLVASLAHELAQPLAAVLSNAQAAVRLANQPTPDLPEIQAALSDIIEDDQRARAVLNNVRTTLKRHALTPHVVNLNEIVESVVLMIKSSAQLHGIQLQSILSKDAVLVQGDEVPLQQVLLNLVNNAMDAMSQLPIERRVMTLKTSVNMQGKSGLLVVKDQGSGIPEDVKSKLFQPFTTTKDDGLGMGLAICHTILQTLGGSIELQNNTELGATFEVVLPLAA
jgi:signal transduction histidine kinase/ABC-type uncharacterized transport system substrate-binding protein